MGHNPCKSMAYGPANTRRWTNDVLMLGQCLRRWANGQHCQWPNVLCFPRGVVLCCRERSYSFMFPTNTGHSPKAVPMLAHRLRRWPNIETALGECPVFAVNCVPIILPEMLSPSKVSKTRKQLSRRKLSLTLSPLAFFWYTKALLF